MDAPYVPAWETPADFESVEHDAAATDLPRLRAAHAAWEAAPKVDGVPVRQAVELERVPDIIGQVGIADVLADGDFRYRMFGSALVGALGYDMTGRLVSDLAPPAYAALVGEQYRQVVARRRPLLHEVRHRATDGTILSYFRLTAPLTLGDGRVDQLWMTVAQLGSFSAGAFGPPSQTFYEPRD